MSCFDNYITISESTAESRSGLYASDLPGIDRDMLDGIARSTSQDADDIWDSAIYKRAKRNFVNDVSKQIQKKFHTNLKLVTRETSSFLADYNTGTSLAGVTVEFSLPKYAKNHLISATVNFNDAWQVKTAADSSRWKSVTYGDGVYVAVSLDGDIMSSNDGATWTTRESPSSRNWSCVAHGNGIFLAVSSGVDPAVIRSTNGITWTLISPDVLNGGWNSVVWSSDLELFVAVSSLGANRVMTSPEGIFWTPRSSADEDATWETVTYGNGLLVAAAESGEIMTSSNGINWTLRTSPNNGWSGSIYGNGLFVLVSTDTSTTAVATSSDGITWTLRTTIIGEWVSVTYGDGLFVAVSATGEIMSSTNGITWTEKSSAVEIEATSVCFGNHLFVVVSDDTTSTNLLTYTKYLILYVYEDDENGELLDTIEQSLSSGKNTINIDTDYESDKLFISYDPTNIPLKKTENKYFRDHNYVNFDAVVCSECFYADPDFTASVIQVNDGGLNIKFLIYCSLEKFVCENLKLFEDAFLYRIGIEITTERRLGERLTQYTVMTGERWTELEAFYKAQYETNLMNVIDSVNIQEDEFCFACRNTVRVDRILP